jgi:hypothetical protein
MVPHEREKTKEARGNSPHPTHLAAHEREKTGEARGNSPHPTHPTANEFLQARSDRIRVQKKYVSVLRISKMDR